MDKENNEEIKLKDSIFCRSIIDDLPLSLEEFRLLHKIARRGDNGCFESIETISKNIGACKKNIRIALASLIEKNLIIKKEIKGKSTIYNLNNDFIISNCTTIKNDTPIKNDSTPLSKMIVHPYQKCEGTPIKNDILNNKDKDIQLNNKYKEKEKEKESFSEKNYFQKYKELLKKIEPHNNSAIFPTNCPGYSHTFLGVINQLKNEGKENPVEYIEKQINEYLEFTEKASVYRVNSLRKFLDETNQSYLHTDYKAMLEDFNKKNNKEYEKIVDTKNGFLKLIKQQEEEENE